MSDNGLPVFFYAKSVLISRGLVRFKIGQKSNGKNLCFNFFNKIADRMLINVIPNTTYLS